MAGRGQKAAGAAVRVRSEERDEGKKRHVYRVRCEVTHSFYVNVEAHDPDEAELLAENFCEQNCGKSGLDFIEAEATHKHLRFEAEET